MSIRNTLDIEQSHIHVEGKLLYINSGVIEMHPHEYEEVHSRTKIKIMWTYYIFMTLAMESFILHSI